MIVNLPTYSDADFVRAFVLSTAVPDWKTGTFYAAAEQVTHVGRVWNAVVANTSIEPGTDATKWALGTAPGYDLTGSTLMLMARAPASASHAPVSVTSAGGGDIEITTPAAGAFTLRIPRAVLAAMAPGIYRQSLIELRVTGDRLPVWHGTLTHEIGPTR